MKIVHLELPRYFTLTVREYMTGAATAAHAGGHSFRQYDLNPNFWRWLAGLSTPHSPGDLFEPLLAASGNAELWPLLAELKAHLNDIGRLYGMGVGLRGIQLPRGVVNSSYAMCCLVADTYGCGLFANFFATLSPRFQLMDADLICFGLDSPEGIFWSLQMAAWLRTSGSKAHFCIARHGWENFSLLQHIDELAKNDWFLGIIQSVILHPEELPRTLRQLADTLDGAPPDALCNIAIKTADGVRILSPLPDDRAQLRIAEPSHIIPDDYFEAMQVPRDHLVYSMAMVRNKCFYKKCSFCVQIAKHIGDNAYSQGADIQRALAACAELERHGVTMVNFMDEAMRPVDIRDFCAGIQDRHIRMHWVGRMIAAAHPSRDILSQMKEAGCIEVLFGLETFDPALAADMGKISKFHESPAQTAAMVEDFLHAGLFVILSMIYEFPTETPEARARTIAGVEALCAKSSHIAVIFNRFSLFHASRMYLEPGKFNIKCIEPRLGENDLQYQFGYECQNPLPPASEQELASMHRLSLGWPAERYASILAARGKDLLDMAYFLDYVSLGFRYRVRNGTTLVDGVSLA